MYGKSSDISAMRDYCIWGVHKDGMLRSNRLVHIDGSNKLEEWLDCISYAWMMLLDSQDEKLAFELYDEMSKI